MKNFTENLPLNFFNSAKISKEKKLFYDKINGNWRSISFSEAKANVISIANFLLEIGIKKNDKIILCSQNRSEWAISNFAIMSIGAIVVPTYTSNTINDHKYILRHSEAKLIFVSGDNVGENILRALSRNKKIENVVFFENATNLEKKSRIKINFYDYNNIVKQKSSFLLVKKYLQKIRPKDICCIIYTSGTGGDPKGVMLTHESIQANVNAAIDILKEDKVEENAVFLSILPLAHSYEHTAGLHLPVQICAQVWYCESSDKISNNLIEARPTLMTAVPRLYEVLYSKIIKGINNKGKISKFLFFKTLDIGNKIIHNIPLKYYERLLNFLLEFLIRSKIRKRFGGKLKYFISGGAPLNPEIGNFFLSLGVNILQGYGQTEASPLISANRTSKIKIETVGPAVKGVTVKLTNENELLVKGKNIMKGYWKDSSNTKKTIKNGWLHTGDLATIDNDNYIKIIGRKKEIIVNSGGENISPAKIETLLCLENEIEQVMIYGDKKPWLSAIIVPSEDIINKKGCLNIISNIIRRINKSLSNIEKIRKYIVIKIPFTIDNGQLTPSLKVRRHKVLEAYGSKLDNLYKR